MNETNWSEWKPYDGSGQPVGDFIPLQVRIRDHKGVSASGTYHNNRYVDWSAGTLVTHYRYDLDHPDAPKQPDWDEGEPPMRNIASNGGTGEHYGRSDLSWLACNISEWNPQYSHAYKTGHDKAWFCKASDDMAVELSAYRLDQINAERQRLGIEPLHVPLEYEPEEVAFKPERSKYHREIKPGVWVDVYDVLHAWGVSNPALQDLIKKALQPGERGHKDKSEDMADIVASALRARELER
jgi:hypothetical protein